MKRLLILLLPAFFACSGGEGGPGGHGGPGAWGQERKEPVTVVEVEEVGRGSVADTLQASALVEAERAASLFPSASGVVLSIHADEGDRVTRGQLLAVIDNVSLDASAERARAEVSRLEEQYRQLEELARRGAVSDRELDDIAFQLQNARTSAREASRSFGQTRLTAPFDGTVARRDVRVGELVTSGSAAFEVVDLDQLRVVASLPERDITRVALDQPARLVSAYDPDAVGHGRVTRISPVVDAGSGTFRVTIDLDDDEGVLRPGQYVTVDLEIDRHHDVVVVPKRAVVYEDGSPVVYLQVEAPEEEEEDGDADEGEGGEGGGGFSLGSLFGGAPEAPEGEDEAEEEDAGPRWVAARTPVDLGLVDDRFAEILTGLSGGERVIVVGQSHLRDGARIRAVADEEEAPRQAGEPEAEEPPSAEADAGSEPEAGDAG